MSEQDRRREGLGDVPNRPQGEPAQNMPAGALPSQGGTSPASYVRPEQPSGGARFAGLAKQRLRPILPGGLTAATGGLVFALMGFGPFWNAQTYKGNVSATCNRLKGTPLYSRCLHEGSGYRVRLAGKSWNGWHHFGTWVPLLLLLVVAVIFVVKVFGYQPRKRRLESTALILVIISDVLFFWAFSNTKDGEVRAWGIYLALVLLILVNIGALLAFVNVDGIMAARAKDREKQTRPADPYDKGHYPVGQSPRYDTPEPPQQPPHGGYVPPS